MAKQGIARYIEAANEAEKDFKHPSPRVPAPRFVADNLHCVNQPPT